MGDPVELTLDCPEPGAESWMDELRSMRGVDAMRSAIRDRNSGLVLDRLDRIVIVGAAAEGVRLAQLCNEHGIGVTAVADDRADQLGGMIGNVPVCSVDALADIERNIPVVIASHRPLQLVQRLRGLGFETVVLFLILQILDPVRFTPHMFYDGWLEDLAENTTRYAELFDAFGDDESRRHLDAVLGFRLTGDIGTIASVVDWDLYAPRDLITLTENEVYVDAGAFDGDSIRLFMERVGGTFDRIVAYEPDPATFQRLARNFEADSRIQARPKGLHRKGGTLRFVDDGSRGAIIAEKGAIEIPVTSLDEDLGEDRVTFVKMNIEGAELDALRGAARSIAKWGPTLAISAYHRPSDLWQVPFLIRELRPEYRLALRQHDAGVIETVAYGL